MVFQTCTMSIEYIDIKSWMYSLAQYLFHDLYLFNKFYFC